MAEVTADIIIPDAARAVEIRLNELESKQLMQLEAEKDILLTKYKQLSSELLKHVEQKVAVLKLKHEAFVSENSQKIIVFGEKMAQIKKEVAAIQKVMAGRDEKADEQKGTDCMVATMRLEQETNTIENELKARLELSQKCCHEYKAALASLEDEFNREKAVLVAQMTADLANLKQQCDATVKEASDLISTVADQ